LNLRRILANQTHEIPNDFRSFDQTWDTLILAPQKSTLTDRLFENNEKLHKRRGSLRRSDATEINAEVQF
jgi:hypothetical protein